MCNIPESWKRDIATCGTYSHQYYRTQLWCDWNDVQKEHALRDNAKSLKALEELLALKEKHAELLGEPTSYWWAPLTAVINVDLNEMYRPSQMLQLINDAIKEENDKFNQQITELYEGFEAFDDLC